VTFRQGAWPHGMVSPPERSSMLRLGFLCLALAIAAIVVPQRLLAQGTVQTQPIDPFGQEVTMAEKPIVYVSGTGEWDTAYETLKQAFQTVQTYLDKAGIKAAGHAMTIYTAMDDVNFNFQAAVPLATTPAAPLPDNIGSGTSPGGRALKFVHRGSFDAMTQTYDAISHHVEEKQISTKELLIEEYVSDFLTTSADKLVINIFVPLE
jgi:effector-binding domain-containing protein